MIKSWQRRWQRETAAWLVEVHRLGLGRERLRGLDPRLRHRHGCRRAVGGSKREARIDCRHRSGAWLGDDGERRGRLDARALTRRGRRGVGRALERQARLPARLDRDVAGLLQANEPFVDERLRVGSAPRADAQLENRLALVDGFLVVRRFVETEAYHILGTIRQVNILSFSGSPAAGRRVSKQDVPRGTCAGSPRRRRPRVRSRQIGRAHV